MTVSCGETKIAIKRCAVCKIDLKGRFVFVDERIESIFEQSLEELFGKPIASFLDPAGQRLVKDLLLKHNKYETSYDSCQVNLVKPDGTSITANLIFSLCFAAGNPVNYQIIIDTLPSTATTSGSQAGTGGMDLLQALSELETPENITNLIPALSQFTGEPRIAFYKLGRDNLTRLSSDVNAPVVIGEPTDLHLELALSGGSYSPDDQEAVSNAIELTGQAPSEFVCAFTSPENSYLMRMILDENLSDQELGEMISRIRQTAKLIGRVLEVSSPSGVIAPYANSEIDLIASSLHAADLIEASAIIINETGAVIQHNLTASKLFQTDLEHCTYHDLFQNNLKMIDRDDQSKFDLYVEQAFKVSDLPRFESAVLLAGNRLASLSAMRSDLSDPKSNLLIIIKPVPKAGDVKSARRIAEMVQMSFNDIQSLCRVANDYSTQLSHEYFSSLDGDGNFVLMCLSSCLDKALLSLSKYNEMLEVGRGERCVSATDLNVLMNELVGAIKERVKNVKVSVSHADLPKIQTDTRLLKTILNILLTELLYEWSEGEIKISVDAITDENQSVLVVQLPSHCSRQALDRLQNISRMSVGALKDDNTETNLVRLTVDHLLGSLDAELEIDAQTPLIKITLPQPFWANEST